MKDLERTDRHVGTPDRLIINLALLQSNIPQISIFPIYSSAVSASHIGWRPGQLPGWLAHLPFKA
jgi:hypothetical protein